MSSTKSAGRCSSPSILMNVSRGSTLEETTRASISSPFSSTTPVARPSGQHDLRDRRLGADLDAGLARRVGDRVRDRAGAAAGEAPGPERAVDLAHVVVEQDVGRAGRAHAEERADDAGRRHRRLEHVGLEPLVEEVDGAHRHELDLVVLVRSPRAAGSAVPRNARSFRPFERERRRIGRRHREDGLDEPAHLDHRLAVLVVGLGVELRVAGDLATRLRVVVDAPEVVAVRHRRERAVERQDLEAVARAGRARG